MSKRKRRAREVVLLLTFAYIMGATTLSFFPVGRSAIEALADDDAAPVAATKAPAIPAGIATTVGDWAQWGGTSLRNNVPFGKGIPSTWDIGGFDRKTGEWDKEASENIKWVARVGSQTYGNPVVADGKVFVGTNNGGGWLARYPSKVDLGCLIAFRESDGAFLWQHSSEKLSSGRVHDWPLQGICCAPLVEGKRCWFVSSRGEVLCVDTEGFHDNEDDGPYKNELVNVAAIINTAPDFDVVVAALDEGKLTAAAAKLLTEAGEKVSDTVEVATVARGKSWKLTGKFAGVDRTILAKVIGPRLKFLKNLGPSDKQDADVIWSYNMMDQFKVSQHNMCSCSVTAYGDILLVNTSNGVDESHVNIPSPDAPSFMAMDKNTGEVLWTDKSPGLNILHGQWSSPTVAELGGVPQAIFAGGDGWVYSFKCDRGKDGKPTLLWKFDCNPKDSKWFIGGRGTRNNIIATPVVYKGNVYVAVGQDPEHGEGDGHLWCIDPTKHMDGSDVSAELAVSVEDRTKTIPHRRLVAVEEEKGEIAIDNPKSAVVWHYAGFDQDASGGDLDFEEQMHRSCGTVAIKDDILYISDFSGLFHCLDATTGKVHWTYDMLAAAWGSPLIVDGKVYVGDEDGVIHVFELGEENNEPFEEIEMGNSVFSTPIVANNILYIANRTHLFAITAMEKDGEE